MRPTSLCAKNAVKTVEVAAKADGAALPKAVGGVLARFKGTIMELMAKRIPEDDRIFLAERWGFSSPVSSSRGPGKLDITATEPTRPAQDVRVKGASVTLTAEDEALSKAREAGAAARRAIDAGHSIRLTVSPTKMGGHERQGGLNGASPATAEVPVQLPTAAAEVPTVKEVPVLRGESHESELHPIFGELVADLEYKRVYRTSIASLVKAPVWEKQRILRPERALAIAEAKLKKDFNGLPGVITLFEQKTGSSGDVRQPSPPSAVVSSSATGADDLADGEGSVRLGIVDGQHRVGALLLMAERGGWDSEARNILVDVFRTNSEKEVSDLFTEINRAEPVRLVDMPGDGATDELKLILNDCTERLQESYPVMFKPSARCRAPHVNIDNLRDEIFQSGLMERHGLETVDDLLTWLERVNAALERRDDHAWAEMSRGYRGMSEEASKKALAKAKKYGFFLGMDKSWLHV